MAVLGAVRAKNVLPYLGKTKKRPSGMKRDVRLHQENVFHRPARAPDEDALVVWPCIR